MKRFLGVLGFGFAGLFSVGLGIWQLKRREWKSNILLTRKDNLDANNYTMGEFLKINDVESMQSAPVHLKGELLYDATVLVGPRVSPAENTNEKPNSGHGYFVLTPLVIDNKYCFVLCFF